MKNEGSKLLLGLGIGAVVGLAIGYLITDENRRKVENDIREVGHGIKEGAKSVFSKVKSKAEHAGSEFAGKAEEWSDKAGDKAEEWADEAGNKASSVADDFSQKANDARWEMDSKSKKDAASSNLYGSNSRKDGLNTNEKI